MGAWQLSRWSEKRALAGVLREALARPAVPLPADSGEWPAVHHRRVIVTGALDASWQVLLSDRWRGDSAGVEVITPVRLSSGEVALLDRGGLPSPDGIHATPGTWLEPGATAWTALLEPLPAHAKTSAWDLLRANSPTLYSARALGADSLAARAPFPIAPWVLRALPEPSAPALPARETPQPPDATMHLSYAVQWFLFALAFLAGGWFVLRRSRSPAGPGHP